MPSLWAPRGMPSTSLPALRLASHGSFPLTVLIVDSNPEVGESLADLLKLNRYEVQVVGNGSEALDAERTDVVILELRLPDLNGCEVVRWMRERKDAKLPFFIAITTCGTPVDRARARAAGIDLFMVKPADPEVLLAIVERFSRVILR